MKYTLFKPNGDLMAQMSKLTKDQAKIWWKEYLEFHKGTDQGVSYLIGYFPATRRSMLEKIFKTNL